VTPHPTARIHRGLLVLAVLAGPILGVVAHRQAREIESDRALAGLERQVSATAFAVEDAFAANLEVLYAFRSLFESGVPVPQERFTRVAMPILARRRCLQALEWIPRVGHSSRAAYEQSDSGLGNDSITERAASGGLMAAGEREWYYPVTFVVPVEGNESAVGFDLGSDRHLREAMDRAVATGEISLTDRVTLVRGTAAAHGVVAFLAVFDGASEITGPREEHLRGFVLAVFRLEELIQQARLGPDSAALTGIQLKLVDDEVDRESLVAQDLSLGTIEFGGQRWNVVVLPTAEHLNSLRTREPLLLGVTAAVAWELTVGLVLLLGRRSHDRLERRHARMMRSILESLTDGVIVADTGGKILAANSAATAISGKSPEDVPPEAWSETYGLFVPGTETHFPPEQLPLARAIRGEASDGVEAFLRNPRVPGGTWVDVRGAPLLSGDGAVRGGVVVFRDVSARKRAEEQLQRLSSAIEQTADSVLITDRHGTIGYVNPAFEATTGYSRAEAVGRRPNILKSGAQDPEYYRELWATILRGEPFRGTTVNRKKDGELYHADQTITAIKDRAGHITHFVSVLRDMTERQKLHAQEMELALASMVQRRLFPARPLELPGYDIAGGVFPAESTCGDYFDFVPMPNDALALVVADVSGHGLGPALVMAETRAYLQPLARTTEDLRSIADAISGFLAADLEDHMFVTMLLAKLEPASGRCSYVNCGHPSGHVINRSGEGAAELKSGGLPLGLFPERWQCTEHEFVLGEGEMLVLVTDGVLESRSPGGAEFGSEGLLQVLREHHRDPAREIVERVCRAVRGFVHGHKQLDDMTIVVCKRQAGPPSS
jgi:PAS domain S-box-containing protein